MERGKLDRRNGSVYYTCHDNQHHFGTGFVVNKRTRDKVIDFDPVNERICKMRIETKPHNMNIIYVHAPTEEKEETKKESF